MVKVYIQTGLNIWNSNPDYKKVEYYDDLLLEGVLIRLDWISPAGLKRFISNNCYDDVEFLSRFMKFNFKKDKPQETKLLDKNDIGDSIYVNDEYNFYGYCPRYNNKLYPHKECAFCNDNNSYSMMCRYRFKDILQKNIESVNEIKRDEEGRIIDLSITANGELEKHSYEKLPLSSKSIPDLINMIPNIKVVRFMNVKTGNKVQMNSININMLRRENKCFGKICRADEWNNYSEKEFGIYDWNKPCWVIQWFVDK